ncbi:AAA family ATPase [Campylobacter sp. RM16188]|uniref:McrB family protein n=1 Tax=Campylobacter sp. RM16188 TaxID=1705725 RepID=UPI001553632F
MDYLEAFETFKKMFLEDKKSIFTGQEVLINTNLDFLKKNFVENPDTTKKKNFDDKIKEQFEKANDDQKDLMANIIWLWRLPPKKVIERRQYFEKFFENLKSDIKIEKNPELFSDFEGFANTGTYYNTNKFHELVYIISFLENWIDPKIKDIEKMDFLKTNSSITADNQTKSVSMRNALLHLFEPDRYLPIISNDHKNKIASVFGKIFNINLDDENIDASLQAIKTNLEKLVKEKNIKITREDNIFYDDLIKNIWQGGLEFESKNMILYGAPGTGKTYLTEQTIKARCSIKGGDYKIVQFHPSFSYEDFIDGVKPTGIDDKNGAMKFELKNGVFKEMCIEAFKELKATYEFNKVASKEDKKEPKIYYFIADEINRAELSRVFGELLLCLEDDKRLRISKDGKIEGIKVKTANSSLWSKDHAVCEVDGEYYFGVPENLYFIGTMNDIDRSIDSFDLALRRRFVWKKYSCDYDVILEKFENSDKAEQYIELCKTINEYITKGDGLNLDESYKLGHSYFMKPQKLTKNAIQKLWEEHIEPILREYLRTQYNSTEIANKLKDMKEKTIDTWQK